MSPWGHELVCTAVDLGSAGASLPILFIGCRFCRALHVYFGLGAPSQADGNRLDDRQAEGLSSLEGVSQLPNNASVHAALLELMHGDVDAGPEVREALHIVLLVQVELVPRRGVNEMKSAPNL